VDFELADGHGIDGDLIAVMDETIPAMGAGVYYVVTTAVILDPRNIQGELATFFDDTPGRKNPFHWHKEGPTARARILDLVIDHGVVAICTYQSVARNKQTRARKRLIEVTADRLAHEEVEHLIIESGDARTNQRDRAALLDHYRDRGGVPFVYDWRSKHERILWIADAINGVVFDSFANQDNTQLDRLLAEGVLTEPPEYIP